MGRRSGEKRQIDGTATIDQLSLTWELVSTSALVTLAEGRSDALQGHERGLIGMGARGDDAAG